MGRTYPILRLGLPQAPVSGDEVEVDELHVESQRQFGRFLAIVDGLDGLRMSASRLGWLSLWRQGFDLTLACLDARVGGAAVTTAALERLATELMLKARALAAEPSKDGLKEGFVALAAWQLWNDRKTQQSELRHLEGVFDSSSTRQLEANPSGKASFEAIHGALPRENDYVLSQQYQEARRFLEAQSKPVEWWLADGQIRRCLPEIEKLARDLGRPPSFPELRTKREGHTTSGQLRNMNLSFVYAQYSGSSQTLHGSTLAQYLTLGEDAIEFGGPSSALVERRINFANVVLRNCWVLLDFTRSKIW